MNTKWSKVAVIVRYIWLINALVFKEAKASSEIENIVTTDDKLYRTLTVKGQAIDTAIKEAMMSLRFDAH